VVSGERQHLVPRASTTRLEEAFRPGSVLRIEVESLGAGREGFAQPNG